MVLLDLVQRNERTLLVFSSFSAIEYDEQNGELSFVGDSTAKPVYIDKGTPADEVWKHVLGALASLQEPRSMNVPIVMSRLDLRGLQTEAS